MVILKNCRMIKKSSLKMKQLKFRSIINVLTSNLAQFSFTVNNLL